MVFGAGFSRASVLAGRPVYGARPATWGALEDKMIIDQLWDDAGRAESTVSRRCRSRTHRRPLLTWLRTSAPCGSPTTPKAGTEEESTRGGFATRTMFAPAVEWFT